MHPSLAALDDTADDLHPIALRGEPNGLAYDPVSACLYVADAAGGAVVEIAGALRRRIAVIETGGVVAGNRLGGVAVTPSGTIFVARLGHGRAGAVFRIDRDGRPRALDLAPEPWRLGLAYDAGADALYTTQYRKGPDGPSDGAIVRIDLASGASAIVADGLMKPVGVACVGDSMVVTDPARRSVLRRSLAVAGSRWRHLADGIGRPDSCCPCSDDSVLVSCREETTGHGAIVRLWLDGRKRVIARGAWEPRGVATDGQRVFVSARRGGCVLMLPL